MYKRGLLLAGLLLCGGLLRAGSSMAEKACLVGQGHLNNKKYSLALTCFEAALYAEPESPRALRGAADCQYYLGDKAAALASYEHYLRVQPTDSGIQALVERLKAQVPPTPAPTLSPTPPGGVHAVHWISPKELDEERRKAPEKAILFDFNAAWCGPCRQMKRDVFGDPELIDWVNGHYIAVDVMDRRHEDGQNDGPTQELQDRYKVEAFPTVVALPPGQGESHLVMGYYGKAFMTRWLKNPKIPLPQ
jgi:thiol-disulfide isomerase/thioredoxin